MRRDNSFYESIINHIQNQVNGFVEKEWRNDECPPEFTLSIGEENKSDAILLTVFHLGQAYTERIFPRSDSYYGYSGLFDMMVNMYNRTM